MSDPVKNLRWYMTTYPGSFIGFFQNISLVLKDLGQEWKDEGYEDWAKVFQDASEQINNINSNLVKVRDEFDQAQDDTVKEQNG